MTSSPAYHLLGRSGLRVSRLSLGTMTFGQKPWGCDAAGAASILDAYLATGGNFIDTADMYGGGASEEILGALVAERGARDKLVIASKYSLGNGRAGPNAVGNGRKSMMAAIDGSLRRLGTDYIDVYYMHVWDGITPVEEVMRGMDDAVAAGKIRYVGLSDVPGWYAGRAQTLAEWRGYAPVAALQLEYSLIERGVELEFPSLCHELGIGMVTWSPLCSGLLSGKHRPAQDGGLAEGRIKMTVESGQFNRLTDHNWAIVAALETAAETVGRSMAEVAVNWVVNKPAVASVILGATTAAQMAQTLGALDFTLPPEVAAALDAASAMPGIFPYRFFPAMQGRTNSGVTPKWPGYYGAR